MDLHEPFTLDQITVFLAVVDQGGFSAAARHLGRVQSAVSHSIATLEAQLGTPLFDRATRPPALTDAGSRLSAEARLVLAQAHAFRQVAGALREGLEPELSLVVDPIYPVDALVDVCRAFARDFSTVSLRLRTDVMGEAVHLVREGHVELGVCNLADATDPLLVAHPAGRVHLVPVCAPAHALARVAPPQRADELRRHTQVVLTERTTRGEDRGVLAAHTWRITDIATKLRLLLAGIGWGSLPRDLVEPHLARGELVQLAPDAWPDGGHDVVLHTVSRADRPLGPAGRWLRARLVLAART